MKSIFSLVFITYFIINVQVSNRNLALENKPPREIKFRRYFSNYNFSGIDYDALADLKNNLILNACIKGVTSAELESLQIPDLEARLQKLQLGKLIIKIDERYHLNFPAIIDNKQVYLEKLVEEISLKLLPTSEKIVQEIATQLKGHEEMLYHVFWSIIMDGPVAWDTLNNELQKQLGQDDASITGTIWLTYPLHPYHAGTNRYGDLKLGQIQITWSPSTPLPSVVHGVIKEYESELIQSAFTETPVDNQGTRQALAQYGLVDGKGTERVFIIDPNSESALTFGKVSRTFGEEVMKHIDVQEAAKMLGVTPAQALVICYHELCYELLEQLATKKLIDIPEIVLKSTTGTEQTYRLISIIDLTKLKSLDQLYKKLGF